MYNAEPMKESIGFIGLGNMGRPMAHNIVAAGYKLWVYNRSGEKAKQLIEQGARQVFHPGEAATPGGIVITMVTDDSALENIVLDKAFLERLGPNGLHLSMSTIAPATARKLAELHSKHGSEYLAAPVFGRPEMAMNRKLWICLSGSQAAKERVRPLLDVLGQGVFDFGENPCAANIIKLTGNFLMVAAMESIAEALALAEKSEIDRLQVMNMLTQALFPCPVYQNYGVAIAQKRYLPVGARLSILLKDIELVLQEATDAKLPMPVANLLHNRLITSIAKGRGDMDEVAFTQDVLEDAGLQ